MSENLALEFDGLQKEYGLSGAEVFSRAIALYKMAKEAVKEGEELLIRAKVRERKLTSF